MSLIKTHDSQAEANFVGSEIKRAIKNSKGLIQFKDIDVLTRMDFKIILHYQVLSCAAIFN